MSTRRGASATVSRRSRGAQGLPHRTPGVEGDAGETERYASRQPRRAPEGQQDPARLRRKRLPRTQDPGDEPEAARRKPGGDPRRGPGPGAPLRRATQEGDGTPRQPYNGPPRPGAPREPGANRLPHARGRARRPYERARPHATRRP